MVDRDAEYAQMTYPGRCRWCGAVYDGAKVTVTARYADCSVWKAPCCGTTADDRPSGWGGPFFPLSAEERRGHTVPLTPTWSNPRG